MVVHNAFHIEPVLKKSVSKITALDTVRIAPPLLPRPLCLRGKHSHIRSQRSPPLSLCRSQRIVHSQI